MCCDRRSAVSVVPSSWVAYAWLTVAPDLPIDLVRHVGVVENMPSLPPFAGDAAVGRQRERTCLAGKFVAVGEPADAS